MLIMKVVVAKVTLKHSGCFQVVPMMLDCVMEMSAVRIKLPQDIRSRDAKQSVGKTVKVVFLFP